MLGVCYFEGRGVEKDINMGLWLIEKSANKKNPEAELKIAKIYNEGIFVEKNLQKAHDFLVISAEYGNKEAKKMLFELFNEEINDKIEL